VHPFIQGFKEAAKPPDRSLPWQWCEKHLWVDDTSSRPGKWRSEYSPWVRAPMEAAARPEVRRVVVKCAAQSAKTQTVMGLCCWAVDQNPGPAMWVMAAKDEAKDFMRDRLMPTFRRCKPVWSQLATVEGTTFVFSSMPFYLTGAHSKSKLQSKPIRWLFLDEVRNYPKGALEFALKRTRSFYNAKEFIISTPDTEGDSVDNAFKQGTQESPHIRCPRCGSFQELLFSRMKWDKDEEAKPVGERSWERLVDSIRYPCASCDHQWRDLPQERRQMARDAVYVAKNPGAPSHTRSFEWNALIAPWVSWRSVLEEYMNAILAARQDPPDLEPLKAFYNETLGMSWTEALGIVDDYGFLEDRKDDYDFGEAWPEEERRFMSADRQEEGGEHYWWLIRAFGPNGASRLVAYGRAETTEQLEEIRERYSVPLQYAIMDSGHRATEVYRWCQKSGWKAFKGDQVDAYIGTVEDPTTKKKKTVRRLWSKVDVDPTFGTHRDKQRTKVGSRTRVRTRIPLYRFAGDTTKDFLAEFMRGLVGRWTIPRITPKEYLLQITAERRVANTDRLGRISYRWVRARKANHLWDCEQMILVAAVITRMVQNGVTRAANLSAVPVAA